MSDAPRVRLLAAGDLERIVAIAATLPEAPHWPADAYRVALAPDAAARRLCLAVEAAAGEALGFAIARIVGDEAELETIAIAQEHQRKGLGRRLLDELMDRLPPIGVTLVTLEVRASNAAALALYKNACFVRDGKRIAYYADPVEDAILMSRKLSL